MSSDAMTYALNNAKDELGDPRTYKIRVKQEWVENIQNKCEAKIVKRQKKYCNCTNRICNFNNCFVRFIQKTRS